MTSEKADPSAKGAAPKPCTQALSRSPKKRFISRVDSGVPHSSHDWERLQVLSHHPAV